MKKADAQWQAVVVFLLCLIMGAVALAQQTGATLVSQIADALGCTAPGYVGALMGEELYEGIQLDVTLDVGGVPVSFRFAPNLALNSGAALVETNQAAESRAKSFLVAQAANLHVDAPPENAVLRTHRMDSDDFVGWQVAFLTSYDGVLGVPIWRVYVATSGVISQLIVNRAHAPVDAVPTVTEQEARTALVSAADVTDTYDQCDAYVMLLPLPTGGDRLRWEITLSKSDGSAQPLSGWVDAKTGEVLTVDIGLGPASNDGKSPRPAPANTGAPPGEPTDSLLIDWRAATAGGAVILLLVFLVVKLRKR